MDRFDALPVHPQVAGVAAAHHGLTQALSAGGWGLSDTETLDLLGQVLTLHAELAALTGELVAELQDRAVADTLDQPSLPALLERRYTLTRAQANAAVREAAALRRQPAVAAALAAGEANPAQATAMVQTLDRVDRLPLVDPDERAWAERFLREQAAVLDAGRLAKAGQDLVEQLTRTPHVDDPADADRLERAADRAYARRGGGYTLRPDGSGRAWFDLDAPAMATLLAGLEPLARPLPADDGVTDPRTRAQRLADALVELVGHALDTATLPACGGERPHVAVTIDHRRLTDQLSGLLLDTGAPLAPSEARRLACDAAILPAVLAGHSQPLDIGRATRTWPAGIRRAVALRDHGCVFPGCDRPAALTRVHHRHHWAAGGSTSLDNAALLCEHHHRVVHRHHWQVILAANGYPALVPPPTIDPTRRPRQHHRFRLRDLHPPG